MGASLSQGQLIVHTSLSLRERERERSTTAVTKNSVLHPNTMRKLTCSPTQATAIQTKVLDWSCAFSCRGSGPPDYHILDHILHKEPQKATIHNHLLRTPITIITYFLLE